MPLRMSGEHHDKHCSHHPHTHASPVLFCQDEIDFRHPLVQLVPIKFTLPSYSSLKDSQDCKDFFLRIINTRVLELITKIFH